MDKITKGLVISACSVVVIAGAYGLLTTAWGAYKDHAKRSCTTEKVLAMRMVGLTVTADIEMRECLNGYGLKQVSY